MFAISSRQSTHVDPVPLPPIANAHIDIWEHAALLYCNLEWLDARDTFEYLARVIRSPKYAMACRLNVGLIHARLGELNPAMSCFQKALHTDATMAITYYLIALTEAELGKLPHAEIAYQICLGVLRDEGADHMRLGFDYDIFQEIVAQNIKAGRESLFTGHLGLERIPAEIIFEAPVREPEAFDYESEWSPERLKEVIQKELSKPASLQDPHPLALTREALKAFVQTQHDRISDTRSLNSTTATATRSWTEPWHDPNRVATGPATKACIAGNARVHSGSTTQNLTSSTSGLDQPVLSEQPRSKKLEPRPARVVNESVGELARFINVTYPGMSIRTAQLLLENEPWWATRSKQPSARQVSTRDSLLAGFDLKEVSSTLRVTHIQTPQRPKSAPGSRQPSPDRERRSPQRIQSNPALGVKDARPIRRESSGSSSSMDESELFRLIKPQAAGSGGYSGGLPSPSNHADDDIARLTEQMHAEIRNGQWTVPGADKPLHGADICDPHDAGRQGSPPPNDGYATSSSECQNSGRSHVDLPFRSALPSRSSSTSTAKTESTLKPPPLILKPTVHKPTNQYQESRAEFVRSPTSRRQHEREKKPLPPIPTSVSPQRTPPQPQISSPPPLSGLYLLPKASSAGPSARRGQPAPPVKRPSPSSSIADSLDILGFGKRWRKMRDRRS